MSQMQKCRNEDRLCMCSGECMKPPEPMHPLYLTAPTNTEKSFVNLMRSHHTEHHERETHHTAEIAKRDRAIEVLIEALNIAKRMIPRTYGEIKTSEPLQLLLKQVDSAEEKAQAILNENFLTTPLEKSQ